MCDKIHRNTVQWGFNDQDNHKGVTPRARHPGEWSQVSLRKHCHEQS